jgi:hypothetical protein
VARHAPPVGSLRRARLTRSIALLLFWIAGLVVGFFALLAIGARFGCGHSSHGLACQSGGTALGVVLVLAVIAVVTAVTVMGADPRRLGRLAVLVAVGLVVLGGCYLGAHALLNAT